MDIQRCNDGSSGSWCGDVDVVTMPLTHFSVLLLASSPQLVGKPKNSHNSFVDWQRGIVAIVCVVGLTDVDIPIILGISGGLLINI